ncbi:MAG: 3-phosphoglycerate dehydrogenase [Clostridia bacterium]|nr:3-phosphoglycerate dehydrogenase [Clostridia bacterium]
MFSILTLNKISATGLASLDADKYSISDSAEAPDAVIVRSASMLDMDMPDSLLAIARAGAGYNNIPVEKCSEAGICVFNTPGANANAVKELTVCGILLASRKIVAGAEWADGLKGEDDIAKKIEKGKSQFVGPEIAGKTLGVFGLGAIGVLVANQAVRMGMNVIGYDPYLTDKAANTLEKAVEITGSLDDIFAMSDYITLHAPVNDSTKDTICAASIAKCKPGVRIVNFARGGLVNSADLKKALADGSVAAYVTDFPSEDLIGVDGVTALPHLGASTPESEENCAVMASRQIAAYLERGDVINSVNYPNITKAYSGGKRMTVIAKCGAETLKASLAAAGVDLSDSACAERGSYSYIVIDGDNNTAKADVSDCVLVARKIG